MAQYGWITIIKFIEDTCGEHRDLIGKTAVLKGKRGPGEITYIRDGRVCHLRYSVLKHWKLPRPMSDREVEEYIELSPYIRDYFR